MVSENGALSHTTRRDKDKHIIKPTDVQMHELVELAMSSSVRKRVGEMTVQLSDQVNEMLGYALVSGKIENPDSFIEAMTAQLILNRFESELTLNRSKTPEEEAEEIKLNKAPHEHNPVDKTALAWAMQHTLGIDAKRDGAYNQIMNLIGLDPGRTYELTPEMKTAIQKDIAKRDVAPAVAAG